MTADGKHIVLSDERHSFDAFGKRRNADWSPGSGTPSQRTSGGFTGHEQLDNFGLVHMNGRIYDPNLGRFLSADPHIQEPSSVQNLNRYSYVNNNPLSYVDPSGYFFKKLFKKLGRFLKKYGQLVVIIAAAITAPYLIPVLGSVGFGALVGAAGAAISGGGLKDIFRGAVIGAISAGVASEIGGAAASGGISTDVSHLLHGVSRGIIAEATGGDFSSGFLSGFVGHYVGGLLKNEKFSSGKGIFSGTGSGVVTARTTVAAIAGELASKAGGGKFQNGAVSAAFAHLFNTELSAETAALKGNGSKIGKALFTMNPRVDSDIENRMIDHFFDDNGADFRLSPGETNRLIINGEHIPEFDQAIGLLNVDLSRGSIDYYDFNPGNRGFPNEQLNTGGRVVGNIFDGTPFYVFPDHSTNHANEFFGFMR